MLDELYKAFRVVVTHEQASALFTEAKLTSRAWPQHMLYLMHLARVSDSSERLIVDNIVKYAAPHLNHMLMILFNSNRLDYIAHSQELIAWAQEVEDERRNAKKMGRDVVAAIGENHQCFNYGAVGHTQYDCPVTSREVSMLTHLAILRATIDVLLWPSAQFLRRKHFVHPVISDVNLAGSWTPGQAVIFLEMKLYFMMQCLVQMNLLCQTTQRCT
ncbi:hypothetical protein CCR75_000440 [Bremia lactucae]|uniref:Uncharacterized protein n=1 Tax=Bremia lactucae TaxID=4779 RepID=A0A976FHE6_BRELC|nr:hypothetical protein CCR75_000440 [Bremia lactucae]